MSTPSSLRKVCENKRRSSGGFKKLFFTSVSQHSDDEDDNNPSVLVKLKIIHRGETRIKTIGKTLHYSTLLKDLERDYGTVNLTYTDKTNDVITIRTDEDLREAVSMYFESSLNYLRITLNATPCHTSNNDNNNNNNSSSSNHNNHNNSSNLTPVGPHTPGGSIHPPFPTAATTTTIVNNNNNNNYNHKSTMSCPTGHTEGDFSPISPGTSSDYTFPVSSRDGVTPQILHSPGSDNGNLDASDRPANHPNRAGDIIIADGASNGSTQIGGDPQRKFDLNLGDLPSQTNSNHSHSIEEAPEGFEYSLGPVLGVGACGVVYLALNHTTGHLLALKQIHIQLDRTGDDGSSKASSRSKQVAALEREILMMRTLKHENIVSYMGIERQENIVNIFLEYVPGGSIASLLEKFGALGDGVVRKYTRQILYGLKYLHDNEIVHRDIKGANILVDNNGNIKLADFGASKKIAEMCAHSFKGTPLWMAPEAIQCGTHGKSSDVWSLGCTVIEMLTAQPPWSDLHTQESIRAMFLIVQSPNSPPIPTDISEQARDFLLLTLQRDPTKRPTIDQLLTHPFIREEPTKNSSKTNHISQISPRSTSPRNFPNRPHHPSHRSGSGHKSHASSDSVVDVPPDNNAHGYRNSNNPYSSHSTISKPPPQRGEEINWEERIAHHYRTVLLGVGPLQNNNINTNANPSTNLNPNTNPNLRTL